MRRRDAGRCGNGWLDATQTRRLLEAYGVVRSLSLAMHGGQVMVMPLLQLKEFDQYTTTHSMNVSVLAMEWESAEDSDAVTGISTQTLGEEVFASTIQASVMGQDVPDELDDAEIERSIKEINEAIRRSSQKKS